MTITKNSNPTQNTEMSFSDLGLDPNICRALKNYTSPTPIQRETIPHLLNGGDVVGCAQTGTGKTAAFALPLLQLLENKPKKIQSQSIRSLILTPTRELAIQIGENFTNYGKHLRQKHAVIFGGVSDIKQISVLKKGVPIVIATPGRLLDLHQRGEIDLSKIEIFVLDEADRMLDMGFFRDVKKIIAAIPKKRQTLMFSATMPTEVEKLALTLLKKPKQVAVNPISSTAERIDEKVFYVNKRNKKTLLLNILKDQNIKRALVFTRTKHGANRLSAQLTEKNIISAAIHGNKSQNARQKALNAFRESELRVLVATDIVARGIDVDGITHVFNYELPNEPESYVHRIGRTARAGKGGIAISFCDSEEKAYLKDIEFTIQRSVSVDRDHMFMKDGVEESVTVHPKKSSRNGNRSRRTNRRNSRSSKRPAHKKTSLRDLPR